MHCTIAGVCYTSFGKRFPILAPFYWPHGGTLTGAGLESESRRRFPLYLDKRPSKTIYLGERPPDLVGRFTRFR